MSIFCILVKLTTLIMNNTLRNILAVIFGILMGGFVNMGIILISGSIIPPPEGADATTMEGLIESMHLFQPRHFIMPFLAHALGTLAGAFLAAKFSKSRKLLSAIIVGLFFILGGITNVFMLPSPVWFSILDIALAYIPMAFLGARLAKG